jgi:hypothetical protein
MRKLFVLITIFILSSVLNAQNDSKPNLETKMGMEITNADGCGVRIKVISEEIPFDCVYPQGRIFIRMHGGWDESAKAPHLKNDKDFFRNMLACKLRNLTNVFLVDSFTPKRYFRLKIKKITVKDLTEHIAFLEKRDAEKIKNNSVVASSIRNSEGESKDIYASNVDFNNPGKYYAIIIGASNYTDPNIPDLDSLPILDAISLKKTLNEQYTFEKENIKELYNPTRRDIVIAFAEMSKKITSNDNLLIFYGGHGHYEKENDIGYWFPTDAESGNPANWLYNDQLVADVKKIKSLHTLLISDACFSGSIFKTRSVNMEEASSFIRQKYQLASRKAITSGTLKTVPNKSVFIKYLLERLNNNKEQFFTASQLFQSIEQPVSNNSKSLPQFGVIQNVGDEGGDFIFIKR